MNDMSGFDDISWSVICRMVTQGCFNIYSILVGRYTLVGSARTSTYIDTESTMSIIYWLPLDDANSPIKSIPYVENIHLQNVFQRHLMPSWHGSHSLTLITTFNKQSSLHKQGSPKQTTIVYLMCHSFSPMMSTIWWGMEAL